DGIVQNVLDTFLQGASQPIASWFPGETLVLPAADRAGTVVLHEIGRLGIHDQIQVLEWLGQAMGRTQVVSTTSASLLPRVQAGAFIDTLYYRLNTVCVDVSA
ncbi:MAG: sigma 54-interacting transcriptional regulator, partial [Burkholderiales bacterium]